jgi:hypothetical protein
MIGSRSLRAATLAVICPGLGHAYLRSWVWSVAWFVLGAGTVGAVLGQAGIDPATFGSPFGLLEAVLSQTSFLSLLLLQVVVTVNVAHAYALGQLVDQATLSRSDGQPGEEALRPCPACGEPLDEDLEFCHWCTYRLDDETTGDQ